MNYKESTRAIIAFNKGREIAGQQDRIFFALDIDEVMPANWMKTRDGQRILKSAPGDEFSLHWANLNPDNKTYFEDGVSNSWSVQYKIFHDKPDVIFKETGFQMHSPLLPYTNYDTPPYEVKDFLLLHFGHYNLKWNEAKSKYYQVLDIHQNRSKSLIKLHRTYCATKSHKKKNLPIDKEWLFDDWNIFALVYTNPIPIFFSYIKEILKEDGIKKYAKLNIWSDELCKYLGINNPSKWHHKLLHRYIVNTQSIRNSLSIRLLDKALSLII